MEKTEHRYFISYAYQAPTGFGFGNAWVSLARPITGHEDTASLAVAIATENDMATVAIAGFQLVEQP